mmetsp:Transcript_72354/g.192345  ORF Transcript_72354/g.192345 Transcript_72354/m.192345 type:complete len:214 (+) Transcript_72354:205-846(+)
MRRKKGGSLPVHGVLGLVGRCFRGLRGGFFGALCGGAGGRFGVLGGRAGSLLKESAERGLHPVQGVRRCGVRWWSGRSGRRQRRTARRARGGCCGFAGGLAAAEPHDHDRDIVGDAARGARLVRDSLRDGIGRLAGAPGHDLRDVVQRQVAGYAVGEAEHDVARSHVERLSVAVVHAVRDPLPTSKLIGRPVVVVVDAGDIGNLQVTAARLAE